MSQATLLAALKARVSAISGIQNVYDYDRNFRDMAAFTALFATTDDKIQGWTISRVAATSEQIARGEARRTHQFRIRGHYGLADASATEKTFQAWIDAIMNDLDSHCSLGGITTGAAPAQLQTQQPMMFFTILCHYCEIIVNVPEDVTYSVG